MVLNPKDGPEPKGTVPAFRLKYPADGAVSQRVLRTDLPGKTYPGPYGAGSAPSAPARTDSHLRIQHSGLLFTRALLRRLPEVLRHKPKKFSKKVLIFKKILV